VENETKRFQTFAANRITMIRERSSPLQWKYGVLSVESFLVTNSWIRGPDFLWTPEDSWPERHPSISEVTNDDPEVKQEIVACSTTVETSPTAKVCLCTIVSKFSSWNQANVDAYELLIVC
jgi:hypothetical protein